MTGPVVIGAGALMGGAVLLTVVSRLWPPAARGRRRRGPGPAALAYEHCPAEGRETPHTWRPGGRVCRSCKTTTGEQR